MAEVGQDHPLNSHFPEPAKVDYQAILVAAPAREIATLQAYLAQELPHEWDGAYRRCCEHSPNLYRIPVGKFEYLFDYVTSALREGTVQPEQAVEDRVVAVHGRSSLCEESRQDKLTRKRPLGCVDVMPADERVAYDKGHFIAHRMGGGLEINIFPQVRSLNRGWSERGKVYRAMERYAQSNVGTYCFSRMIYAGKSWHPMAIEYGVLKTDGTLWVEQFDNAGDAEELAEIERLIAQEFARRASGA